MIKEINELGWWTMIVYDPFWRTLKLRGSSSYQLIHKHGYSSHTLFRMRHNLGISTALIDDLCELLDCKVEDILEYVPESKTKKLP